MSAFFPREYYWITFLIVCDAMINQVWTFQKKSYSHPSFGFAGSPRIGDDMGITLRDNVIGVATLYV